MADLSPAAQAVLNAANSAYDDAATVAQGTAAALRAAADQVVLDPIRLPRNSYAEGAYDQRLINRRKLLAIAAELENNND